MKKKVMILIILLFAACVIAAVCMSVLSDKYGSPANAIARNEKASQALDFWETDMTKQSDKTIDNR